jgi:hypothetical protein
MKRTDEWLKNEKKNSKKSLKLECIPIFDIKNRKGFGKNQQKRLEYFGQFYFYVLLI